MSGNNVRRELIPVGRRHLSGVLIVVLSSIQPVFANGSSFQQGSSPPAPTRRVDPYKKLFQQPPLDQTARAQRRADTAASTAPRVVCGMTVIPMDPSIDPKMIIPRPPGDTRYTIRAIPPPICK